MSKKKAEREHKSGLSTGYDTDGTNYWIAPVLVDSWGAIQDQAQALDRIMETTINVVAQARVQVEAQRRKWWDRVYTDLGLDRSILYTFSRLEGKVFSLPIEEEKK